MSYRTYKSYGLCCSHLGWRRLDVFGGLFFIALVAVFLLPKPARAEVTADHLVISEIQTGLSGSGNSGKDFIELYNPTDSAVDLDGYRLVKRTKTGTSDTAIKSWTTSTVIPAKTYYLWANNDYAEVAADARTAQTVADNNAVALRRGLADTGEVVDAMAWGENASGLAEAVNFSQNIPDGQSLARLAETNNNANDFSLTAVPTPLGLAAGAQASPPATPATESPAATDQVAQLPPEVFLSEFLGNPSGDDSGREWVEIYNNSDYALDLANWALDDGSGLKPDQNAYALPVNSLVNAKSYKSFLIPKGKFSINNAGGDSLRLFNPELALQDIINFSDNGAEEKSYAKDTAGFWRWTSILTPDLANRFIAATETEDEKLAKEKEAELSDKNSNPHYASYQIVFNEIFGNAKGADEGNEWVELLNRGEAEVDLAGWYLDDEGAALGKNAFVFPTGSIIKPGGLLAVALPEKSFTVTNSGETVRLLDPNKRERASVILPALAESQSFARLAKLSEGWQLSLLPTFGQENIFASAPRRIVISNVNLASADAVSAITLKNMETEWVNLAGWKLVLGEKEYVLPSPASIAPKAELRLDQDITNLNLTSRNSADLELRRPDDAVQARGLAVQTAAKTEIKSKVVAVKRPVALAKTKPASTGLVAGQSDVLDMKSTSPVADNNQSPIIIEDKSRKSVWQKIRNIIRASFRF